MQTFITPEGKIVKVEDKHIQAAVDKGLTYVRKMRNLEGKETYVKSKDINAAKEKGFRDAELDEMALAKSKEGEVGKGEAALRGYGNFGSMGFVDELAGAVKAPLGAAKSALNLIPGVKFQDKDVADYKAARDMYRAEDDKAWEAQPGAYAAGAVPGAVLTSAVPLGGGVKAAQGVQGAGKLARIGKALTGRAAAEGAVQGVGAGVSHSADLTAGDRSGVIDAGVYSGIVSAAIPGVSNALTGKAARALANKQALKAAGLYSTHDINKIANARFGGDRRKAIEHLGQRIREDKIVGFGSAAGGDDVIDNLNLANEKFITEQGDILKQAKSPVSLGKVASDYMGKMEAETAVPNPKFEEWTDAKQFILQQNLPPDELSSELRKLGPQPNPNLFFGDSAPAQYKAASRIASDLDSMGEADVHEAIKIAQAYSKSGNYAKKSVSAGGENAGRSAGRETAYREGNEAIRAAIDDVISRDASPEIAKRYKNIRNKEVDTLELLNLANKRYGRDTANNGVGLTSYPAGATGAQMGESKLGKLAGALGFGALNELKRRYGNSTMMSIMGVLEQDGVTNGLKKVNQLFGPRVASEVGNAIQGLLE